MKLSNHFHSMDFTNMYQTSANHTVVLKKCARLLRGLFDVWRHDPYHGGFACFHLVALS